MKTKSRITLRRTLILLLVLVIIGDTCIVTFSLFQRIKTVETSFTHLNTIADELELMAANRDLNVNKASLLISEAKVEISVIREETSPFFPVLDTLSQLPMIGKYAGQVTPLVEYSYNLISATEELVTLGSSALDGPVLSEGQFRLAQGIIARQGAVEAAAAKFNLADNFYRQIKLELLPNNIQKKMARLAVIQPLLVQGIEILQIVPVIAGTDRPMTYLIMLQNSDELRPTGGFITAFGLVRLEQGVLTLLEFDDSTEQDYMSEIIEAPAPLKDILLAHYWLPRDANWSPSFPESAQEVQRLYTLSTGVKTDGVIAVNQSTLGKLLTFTGPIVVDGTSVSAETIKDYMIGRKMDAINAGKSNERKEFMTPLVEAIISQLSRQSGQDKLIEFARLVREMAEKGDFFVYINYEIAQKQIEMLGLDGGLHPGNADYLMVVDSNLGYNKIDQVITRSLTYRINLTDLIHPSGIVTMSYENPMEGEIKCQFAGNVDFTPNEEQIYLKPGCYWDYWRILGAPGTQINDFQIPRYDEVVSDGFDPWKHAMEQSIRMDGISEVGGLMVLPPGKRGTTQITRGLPTSVINRNGQMITYRLVIQKQGERDNPLPLKIEILAPNGATPEADNKQFTEEDGVWVWQTTITEYLTQIAISFNLP